MKTNRVAGGQFLLNLSLIVIFAFSLGCMSGLEGAVESGSSTGFGGMLYSGASAPDFDIYIGVSESTGNRSYLKRLIFNSDTNAVTDSSYLQMSYNAEYRGMGLDASGNIVVANAQLGTPLEVVGLADPSNPSLAGSVTLDVSSNPAADTFRDHTTCVLPNGNKVVGGYNPGNTVYLNEYTSSGVYIRTIHSSPHISFNISMNKCVAASDIEIYFLDANSSVGGGAKLMRFTRASSSSDWSVADQMLDSDFDTANGTSGSSFWSLAVDLQNNYVYTARYMDTGTQSKKIIRCPRTGFNTANCVGVGDDIPGDSRVKSMVVIPGTGDLLVFAFIPNDTLYRYNSGTGTFTTLFDLTTMDLGADTYSQPWAKAILK